MINAALAGFWWARQATMVGLTAYIFHSFVSIPVFMVAGGIVSVLIFKAKEKAGDFCK